MTDPHIRWNNASRLVPRGLLQLEKDTPMSRRIEDSSVFAAREDSPIVHTPYRAERRMPFLRWYRWWLLVAMLIGAAVAFMLPSAHP